MYTKLHSDVLLSSLWAESDATRITWITLLAMVDANGMVNATLPGIAHMAREPIEEVEKALAIFQAPDPNSKTPDNEGRRVERVPGGYLILNHKMYREIRNVDDKNAYMRDYMRRKRAVGGGSPELADTEVKAEAKAKVDTKPVSVPTELAALPLYAADTKLCKRFTELMAAWKAACPGVSILGEIAKAHAWEVGNPGKVKRDRARFLTNWLNRAQDSPRSNKPPPGSEAAQHTAASERFRDSDIRADALQKKREADIIGAATKEQQAATFGQILDKLGKPHTSNGKGE